MQDKDNLVIKKHAIDRYYQRVIAGIEPKSKTENFIKESWKNATFIKAVLDHKGEFWKVTKPYPCTFVVINNTKSKPVLVTVLWPDHGESTALPANMDLDVDQMKTEIAELKIFSEGLIPALKYVTEHVHNT